MQFSITVTHKASEIEISCAYLSHVDTPIFEFLLSINPSPSENLNQEILACGRIAVVICLLRIAQPTTLKIFPPVNTEKAPLVIKRRKYKIA